MQGHKRKRSEGYSPSSRAENLADFLVAMQGLPHLLLSISLYGSLKLEGRDYACAWFRVHCNVRGPRKGLPCDGGNTCARASSHEAVLWWMQELLRDRAPQSTLSWIMHIALQIRPLFPPCSDYRSWQVILWDEKDHEFSSYKQPASSHEPCVL